MTLPRRSSEIYDRLLRGEATSAEYVAALRKHRTMTDLRHNYLKRTEKDRNAADAKGVPTLKKMQYVWSQHSEEVAAQLRKRGKVR